MRCQNFIITQCAQNSIDEKEEEEKKWMDVDDEEKEDAFHKAETKRGIRKTTYISRPFDQKMNIF